MFLQIDDWLAMQISFAIFSRHQKAIFWSTFSQHYGPRVSLHGGRGRRWYSFLSRYTKKQRVIKGRKFLHAPAQLPRRKCPHSRAALGRGRRAYVRGRAALGRGREGKLLYRDNNKGRQEEKEEEKCPWKEEEEEEEKGKNHH